MHRTDHAGIEAAHDVMDCRRQRLGGARRQARQRLLQCAGLARRIARREIPGGRCDDLIVVNPPAPDGDPVTQRSARRLDQTNA